MLDTLWTIFLGSIAVFAIVLVWIVIIAFILAGLKQWRKKPTLAKITVKNVGAGTLQIVDVRNVTTGKTKRVEFTLEPEYSKTIDLSE